MNQFFAIILLAVLVEGLIEYFGNPIPSLYKRYASLILGIVVCVLYEADLLAMVGLESEIEYVGAVLTGAVVGRGANYVNDFISRLNVIRQPATTVDRVERNTHSITG